jgi:enterochelin esterase-like enzyme
LRNLRIAQFLDEEIHAHRMPPTIAVIPSTNPSALRDDECVNAVNGQADDTYLTTDIRTDMLRDFRVLSGRQDWALAGYSTGGYCAVNLAVRHPGYYSAAVSFSGYFYPITDYTTGDLYHGDRQVKDANSPLLTLDRDTAQGREQPATAFFLTAGSLEHGPPGQLRTLLSELRAPASGVGVMVPNGGHDWGPWRQELPVALDWVGRHFGGVLAPALRPDHGETIMHASATSPKLLTARASGKPVPRSKPVAHRILARQDPSASATPGTTRS